MLGGREARCDRRECRRRGARRHRGDRAALHPRDRWRSCCPPLELVPTEAIDHEEDHLIRPSHTLREPRGERGPPRGAAQESRHDGTNIGAGVVGKDRVRIHSVPS